MLSLNNVSKPAAFSRADAAAVIHVLAVAVVVVLRYVRRCHALIPVALESHRSADSYISCCQT